MKTTLHNFGSMLSILFLAPICNLAGFRNCLAEYTEHSLSPCYTSLSALVLLNSVARWCTTTPFFTKMVSFTCLCAWTSEGIYPRGPLVDSFKRFYALVDSFKSFYALVDTFKSFFKYLGNFKRFKTIPK